MSQLFASSGQSIGVSASTSVLPMNNQDSSPLGWTGWISLQSKGLKSLLQYHSSKASILWCSAFFMVQLSHPYMTTGESINCPNSCPLKHFSPDPTANLESHIALSCHVLLAFREPPTQRAAQKWLRSQGCMDGPGFEPVP